MCNTMLMSCMRFICWYNITLCQWPYDMYAGVYRAGTICMLVCYMGLVKLWYKTMLVYCMRLVL